jgi:hypothetical protein
MVNSSITLNTSEISDEVYNELMMAFVTKAIEMGIHVPKGSKMENWTLRAEIVKPATAVH